LVVFATVQNLVVHLKLAIDIFKLNVKVHVFHAYNLAFILNFAVLEL